MSNLEEIKENYQRMSAEELIRLAERPQDLRPDVLPLLQSELFSRGQQKEALSITEYLVQPKDEVRYSNLSLEELKQHVDERLAAGESLESIRIDLKEAGVNILDLVEKGNELEANAFDYITELKQQGLSEYEIDKKLKDVYSIKNQDIEILKSRRRSRGSQNIAIGFAIVIITSFLFFASAYRTNRATIGLVVLFSIGIWRIIKGFGLRKE